MIVGIIFAVFTLVIPSIFVPIRITTREPVTHIYVMLAAGKISAIKMPRSPISTVSCRTAECAASACIYAASVGVVALKNCEEAVVDASGDLVYAVKVVTELFAG